MSTISNFNVGPVPPTKEELDFQERMRERMRQAMGDLMPDAVLAGIVARGIEDTFFKPQFCKVKNSWGGWNDEQRPSWLIEFIEKETRAQVEAAVKKWVVDNQDKIALLVKERMDQGLASSVIMAFDRIFQGDMMQLQNGIGEAIQRLRERS